MRLGRFPSALGDQREQSPAMACDVNSIAVLRKKSWISEGNTVKTLKIQKMQSKCLFFKQIQNQTAFRLLKSSRLPGRCLGSMKSFG